MKLATLWGIGFHLNPLFLLLMAAAAWTGRLTEALTVFGVVLLHELGHVVAARGFGVRVTAVELWPFGGVARMEGLLEADPRVEAGIALAGPLTNLVLMGLGAVAWRYQLFDPAWAQLFVGANGLVAGFNLLPALPLDGGRLYRAHRSRRIGYRRATYQAVRLGRWLGGLLALAGGAGVYLGPVAVTVPVLGAFVFWAAGREAAAAAYVFMAALARKRQELATAGCLGAETLVARADTPVKQVVERFVPQRYHVVWVVDGAGQVRGVASEAQILDCLFDRGADVPVGDVAAPCPHPFIDIAPPV